MASELFERFVREGEAVLDQMMVERTPEGVDLEFKTKERATTGAFERADRRALGRSLSAFANSAGGVLIFGVRAAKGPDEVDCARELAPIANVEAFASSARQLVGQLLMPRHDGIRVHHVVRPDNSGFLVIDVDRSLRRPHMSKAPDDGRYYKRAGDSTFAMEHYDIEDAFRRYTAPELSVSHRLAAGTRLQQAGQETVHLHMHLFITAEHNSARFPSSTSPKAT
jgi:predicted HTH transcriptional regulator